MYEFDVYDFFILWGLVTLCAAFMFPGIWRREENHASRGATRRVKRRAVRVERR